MRSHNNQDALHSEENNLGGKLQQDIINFLNTTWFKPSKVDTPETNSPEPNLDELMDLPVELVTELKKQVLPTAMIIAKDPQKRAFFLARNHSCYFRLQLSFTDKKYFYEVNTRYRKIFNRDIIHINKIHQYAYVWAQDFFILAEKPPIILAASESSSMVTYCPQLNNTPEKIIIRSNKDYLFILNDDFYSYKTKNNNECLDLIRVNGVASAGLCTYSVANSSETTIIFPAKNYQALIFTCPKHFPLMLDNLLCDDDSLNKEIYSLRHHIEEQIEDLEAEVMSVLTAYNNILEYNEPPLRQQVTPDPKPQTTEQLSSSWISAQLAQFRQSQVDHHRLPPKLVSTPVNSHEVIERLMPKLPSTEKGDFRQNALNQAELKNGIKHFHETSLLQATTSYKSPPLPFRKESAEEILNEIKTITTVATKKPDATTESPVTKKRKI